MILKLIFGGSESKITPKFEGMQFLFYQRQFTFAMMKQHHEIKEGWKNCCSSTCTSLHMWKLIRPIWTTNLFLRKAFERLRVVIYHRIKIFMRPINFQQ